MTTVSELGDLLDELDRAKARAANRVAAGRLDEAIRLVARVGRRDNPNGSNWSDEFQGLRLKASEAGRQTASVDHLARDARVYEASGHGKTLKVFRDGPWVDIVLAEAGRIRADLEEQARASEAAKLREQLDNLSPLSEIDQ